MKLACLACLLLGAVAASAAVNLQATAFTDYIQDQYWGQGDRPDDEDDAIYPFTIDFPTSLLEDLMLRLNRSRTPRPFQATEWEHGADFPYMHSLLEYWRTDFDWPAAQAELNSAMPQYTTTIDGLELHFVHVESDDEDAIPIILTHGWPSSFVEFEELVPLLTNPGDGQQAFHVVAASIPGFGFSKQAAKTGMNHVQTADLFVKLMARLGYDQYVAHGGDWGHMISSSIGLIDVDHCFAVHVTLPIAYASDDYIEALDLSDYEIERMANQTNIWDNRGFSHIQGTKPHTIGMALADSPIGQAAWIIEKFWEWTDTDLHEAFDTPDVMDALLKNVMIYWISNTATSSAFFYRENVFETDAEESITATEVLLAYLAEVSQPTGVALFPAEIVWNPQVIAELRWPNIVSWNEYDAGGHFAALEVPEDLAQDIIDFVTLVNA